MSPPYDNSRSRRTGGVGRWMPLAITVTVATVGLAAWMLSQHNGDSDSEDEDVDDGRETPPEQDLYYNRAEYGENSAYGTSFHHPIEAHFEPSRPGPGDGSISGRVQSALRRTPSPQQFFDNAGKTIATGIAATSAAITNTLAAIREEDKSAFADHETWSEEADAKKQTRQSETHDAGKRRKTVAIVVSADSILGDLDNAEFIEHASILSHIPNNINYNRVRFFVLIYAPVLKEQSLEPPMSNKPPPSLDSSYSKIEPPDMTPGSEKSPLLMASSNSNAAFIAVQSQAAALVEKHTMVLPFTSVNGHVHILRHLQPDVIYLQESLSGDNGSVVSHIQTWMKHDICIVVGAEGGHGALADSESDSERIEAFKPQKWWQREDRVGRGRGVVVVDGMRVHDDWVRRVEEKD